MWSLWVDLIKKALLGYESCRWRHLWRIYWRSPKSRFLRNLFIGTFNQEKLFILWLTTMKSTNSHHLKIHRTSPESGNFQWTRKAFEELQFTGIFVPEKLFILWLIIMISTHSYHLKIPRTSPESGKIAIRLCENLTFEKVW